MSTLITARALPSPRRLCRGGCRRRGRRGRLQAVLDVVRPVPEHAVHHCLAAPGKTPVAKVEVTRGKLNDQLELNVRNLKPDLDFDLFTVEKTRSSRTAPPTRASAGTSASPGTSPTCTPTATAGRRHDQDDPARPDLRLRRQPWCPTVNTFNVGSGSTTRPTPRPVASPA
jgi:hypothetical protein